jgi:hypothetical protein
VRTGSRANSPNGRAFWASKAKPSVIARYRTVGENRGDG